VEIGLKLSLLIEINKLYFYLGQKTLHYWKCILLLLR